MRLLGRIGALLITCIALAACGPPGDFVTNADTSGLKALRGGRVVLLSFHHDREVIVGVSVPPQTIIDACLSRGKMQFLSKVGSSFAVADETVRFKEVLGSPLSPQNILAAGNATAELGAIAGVIVKNSFGYDMGDAGNMDRDFERVPNGEQVKNVVNFLLGPSHVQNYQFVSEIVIISPKGKVLWRFRGKTIAYPSAADTFDPKEMARSFMSLDPSAQTIAANITRMSNSYFEFSAWLLKSDIEGVKVRNYAGYFDRHNRAEFPGIIPGERWYTIPSIAPDH